jgi:hypothetical protein
VDVFHHHLCQSFVALGFHPFLTFFFMHFPCDSAPHQPLYLSLVFYFVCLLDLLRHTHSAIIAALFLVKPLLWLRNRASLCMALPINCAFVSACACSFGVISLRRLERDGTRHGRA